MHRLQAEAHPYTLTPPEAEGGWGGEMMGSLQVVDDIKGVLFLGEGKRA